MDKMWHSINKNMDETILTPKQLQKMRHALGLDSPYSGLRGPAAPYKAFRNYYYTPVDTDWEILVDRGLAVCRKDSANPKNIIYNLTPKGVEVASSYLGIEIVLSA